MGLHDDSIVILVVKILFLVMNIWHIDALLEYYIGQLEHLGNMHNRMKDCTKLYSQKVPEIYKRNKISEEPDTHEIRYHVRWTIEHKCCEGYVQSDSQTCVPHCSQSCENGICEKPNVCVCNEGYLKSIDANGKESCIPVCSNDCINGTCIAPELCSCNENYWLDSDGFTCRPNCNTECEKNYGYCAEPNVCTCRSNYRRIGNDSSPFMCEPVCAVPCKNGHCMAPNVCQCANGYEPDEYDPIFTCKPKCDKPCNGGTCTSPGTCTCDRGYKLVNESFCEPICSEPCQMGTCVAPEICRCNENYQLRENSKYVCESMCKNKCGNGTCIYGRCFCNREYFLNYTTGTCESYCLTHCKPNGTCNSDDTCSCPDGYSTNFETLKYFHLRKLLMKEEDRNFCEPVCDFKCIKGKCTAPNVCTCNDGYLPSWTEPQNNSDDRICTEFRPCNALSCKVNERCDISGSCVCNHGYVKNVFGEGCIPSCTPSCINSNCTEPNRCTCNDGFTPRNESFCEPICKRGCQNGDCISPDHCICHKDFVQNVYNDSGPYCISPCTRNCTEHGECVIDHNLDYKCECHFGWTGEDCDQSSMCVTMMTYDHGDVNRITIRNDTNNTIMQILKSAPNCYQCDSSLNKDTLCYMVHSDKDNTTSVGCLLSTELPCYMTRHYKGSIISTKIVWPFVSIAILLIIGLTVAAFVIYHKCQKKKLTGISANIFIRKSYCSEVLLPENEM